MRTIYTTTLKEINYEGNKNKFEKIIFENQKYKNKKIPTTEE